MIMMDEPRKIVLRRPNQLPTQIVGIEPEKQPKL